ncbi:MAG: hypothetical protein AB2823_13125 [Candidatus Thiodiazotropha endolucinida]
MTVGILAYGSLIEDPGAEIESLINDRISNVKTPFSIEFSRTSSTRGCAPTLVPVKTGGKCVEATILVLSDTTTQALAEDLLWRRETRNELSDKHYKKTQGNNLNKVVVESIPNFNGLDAALYTSIGANIKNPSASELAKLAIKSAQCDTVPEGKDGISYLISVKRQKIVTPLMGDYENEILSQLGVYSLEEALSYCRQQ